MGGYLLRTPDPDLLDFPVHADQLLFLIENGYVDYPQQDLADLDDKNKRDTLARCAREFSLSGREADEYKNSHRRSGHDICQ